MTDTGTIAINPAIRAAFAPTGTLRASINLGNPILANPGDGVTPGGVSVDLARELAALLELPLELVVFDTAGKSVAAVESGQADVGFFAIDPVRGADIAFTAPYVLIEGCYLVKDDSPLTHNEQVDDPALRVVVGKGSAYDLYLTRELQHATIVRAPSSPAVVDVFLAEQADVAAGVRQQLQLDADRLGGLRLLGERFMVIQQAMGIAKARGDEAAQVLHAFVEAAKARGLVDAALARHGVQGASVAPPA
ncbi:polar amino acid transport system substrate-binding protein [Duganella sp. 3397]|uniref:transporter substrate-binding domain-containing protein n=1 Tax=Duganella sp. 3397 TaxID=2817732 RepID=UPI0028650596|nr:transporter substrate-binding domain-containing protein [Duganella sp. 3397]MDR7051133.1 polar amino acid transport system substrate-binding protein [Duganella sp. 3397]